MHFNDLHDDVLNLVFQAALPAIKREPADVKSGLGLLSVCRRWRGVARPMVYDTVVVKCGTERTDGPETVDIETTLDLVVDAKCLHMVRKVVIDVRYWTNPFQGLKAVIERVNRAAGMWAGVRRLELRMNAWGSGRLELNPLTVDHKNEIAGVSSALAALIPGLREIKFEDFSQTPMARVLFGQLAGFYADQLQVLHLRNALVMPQDRVFARLRDVKITGLFSGSLEGKLPRLNPEVVESLELEGLAANDMWSMFCADLNGCAITFPRLTYLHLRYRLGSTMDSEELAGERPWSLQFPAAKCVRIASFVEECPSMENAVFPDRLESLYISRCFDLLSVVARRKIHISRNLIIFVSPESNAINRRIGVANRMLEAADSCPSRKLAIGGMEAIPPELITYTGLTHLHFNGPMSADDVIQLIRRQRQLVYLHINGLNLDDIQTDFSIPACAEHEPVAPLVTQLRGLAISKGHVPMTIDLAFAMLKYLLLRIPTLKSVTTRFVPVEKIQAFIDEYIQWYPHLANVKLIK